MVWAVHVRNGGNIELNRIEIVFAARKSLKFLPTVVQVLKAATRNIWRLLKKKKALILGCTCQSMSLDIAFQQTL